jgi:uncharacterized protein YoxC
MIEASLIVIAISFVVLVIFLVITLLKANRVLDRVDRTLTDMNPEIKSLTIKSNQIADSLIRKSESLDGIFDSINQVKHIAERKIESFLPEKKKVSSFNAEDLVTLAASSIILWQKIKKGKE